MKNNVDLRFTLPQARRAPAMSRVLALLDVRAMPQAEASAPHDVALWQREAASGSPEAQYELAKMLTSGNPISADNRAAVKWLRKAAEKEHAASQHMLGVLIARGQGVRANPQQAVALFRSAAIVGNADAQYDLARALSHARLPPLLDAGTPMPDYFPKHPVHNRSRIFTEHLRVFLLRSPIGLS